MKKMLVATDFSQSSVFLESNIDALGKVGISEIVLVNVLDGTDTQTNDSEGRRGALQKLDDVKQTLENKGFQVEAFLRWGDPAAEINIMASEEEVDFILISSQPRNYLKRAFLGSVSLELAKISSCPVLIIKNSAIITNEEVVSPFQKVMIPTDFSLASLAALDVVKTMREAIGEVVFIHVVEDVKTRERSEVALTELVEEMKVFGVDSSYYIVEGTPAKDIIKMAEELSVSMVFLPKSGGGFVKNFLIGSTAQKVAVELELPVMIIPVETRVSS